MTFSVALWSGCVQDLEVSEADCQTCDVDREDKVSLSEKIENGMVWVLPVSYAAAQIRDHQLNIHMKNQLEKYREFFDLLETWNSDALNESDLIVPSDILESVTLNPAENLDAIRLLLNLISERRVHDLYKCEGDTNNNEDIDALIECNDALVRLKAKALNDEDLFRLSNKILSGTAASNFLLMGALATDIYLLKIGLLGKVATSLGSGAGVSVTVRIVSAKLFQIARSRGARIVGGILVPRIASKRLTSNQSEIAKHAPVYDLLDTIIADPNVEYKVTAQQADLALEFFDEDAYPEASLVVTIRKSNDEAEDATEAKVEYMISFVLENGGENLSKNVEKAVLKVIKETTK